MVFSRKERCCLVLNLLDILSTESYCCLSYRPFWLSPTQAIVIPVAPKYEEYANKVCVNSLFACYNPLEFESVLVQFVDRLAVATCTVAKDYWCTQQIKLTDISGCLVWTLLQNCRSFTFNAQNHNHQNL